MCVCVRVYVCVFHNERDMMMLCYVYMETGLKMNEQNKLVVNCGICRVDVASS